MTAGAPACGSRATPELAADREPGLAALELIDAVVWPAEPASPGTDRTRLFGGVSGLTFDPRSGRYLAVIDDRLPARVAWLDVAFDGRLRVTRQEVAPIVPAPGVDARRVTAADLEAVVALPDGSFVIVEEGHRVPGAAGPSQADAWPAALMALSRDLVVTRIDDWPSRFALGADSGGIRANLGAESLALTPDGRLVAGLEQPLYADSAAGGDARPSGGTRGGPGRLVEFVTAGGRWQARRQWLYWIAPTPVRPGYSATCADGENGLADLLALDETRFLALERACLLNPETRQVRNTATLFLVDVSNADDVSAQPNLQAPATRGVKKTRLLDFDDLIPSLPAELAHLENFEALAFGPPLPDGSRSLLIVSDDNFRATQKTAFLLLRIGGRRLNDD